MTIDHNQFDVSVKAESTQSVPVSGKQDCYLIVKDNKGKCLSFNYADSNSNLPYSGFNSPVPEYYRAVVKELVEENNCDNRVDFIEFIKEIELDERTFRFLISRYNISINGQEQNHFLIRLMDQLHLMLDDCNQQLNKEKGLNKMNSRCISSVSHDFRTPLSIIYANLQLLEYHEFQLDRATIEDAFSLSRMAVKSLLRVLDKVTVVDSINKGRLEFKPGQVNLKMACENLVKGLNEAEVVSDRVVYIHDQSIQEVEIDEYLFTSLFTHLIFNALSYSRKNHKVLFESKVIAPDYIQFTVEDNGIGLTVEQLDALSVFFASSEGFHTDIVGLGLAIVKECLHLQKGSIQINTELGKGTKFIIELPVNLKF